MDELLADFYEEKRKIVEKESKQAKAEELDTKEASLSKLVDECQIQADNSSHRNILVLFAGCIYFLRLTI